jgi:Prokaryotic N-terminal methylation motif
MRRTSSGQSRWQAPVISLSPTKRTNSKRHHASEAGFTLVEVVIAAAITALVAGALAHIFSTTLTFRTQLPDADSFSQDAHLGINLLGSDIRGSTSIVGVSGAKITLQSGDGSKISYSWDGTPGSPLTRQIDSELVQPALSAVQAASFKLETISRQVLREVYVKDTLTAKANSFYSGDWDEWVAETSCYYIGPNTFLVRGWDCIGEHFTLQDEFLGFYSVGVHWGNGGVGLNSDLLVEIYVVDQWDRIQYRVAHVTFSRSLTESSRKWIYKRLTTDVVEKAVPGEYYLLSCRAANQGTAGYLGYERMGGCGSWPDNGMWFTYSVNWGNDWTGSSERELFYDIQGYKLENRLAERVVTEIDTLGISYNLTLLHNGDQESYGGYLAWAK